MFQTTPEYPAEEYNPDDESFDAEQEYNIDPDFQNPDVTDDSTLSGLNQEADANLPPLDPYGGDVNVSLDPQTDHTAPTNGPPEEVVEPLHPENTVLEAYPVHPIHEMIDVDEEVNFDSGGEAESAKKRLHFCTSSSFFFSSFFRFLVPGSEFQALKIEQLFLLLLLCHPLAPSFF